MVTSPRNPLADEGGALSVGVTMRTHDADDWTTSGRRADGGDGHSIGVSTGYNATPMRKLAFLAIVVGLGACESAPASGPSLENLQEVTVTVTHRSEWRVLWVEGTTDLPNGASLSYGVTHALARTAPPRQWPAPNLIDSGRVTVRDGQYWARVNTLNWPPGEVEILIQFPLPPQPPEVVARYGEFGEYLTGPNVTDLDGIKAVQVRDVFQHAP